MRKNISSSVYKLALDKIDARNATIERLTAERDAALGLNHAWPTIDVLTKLADAADHLLGHRGCDTHGWEEYRAASIRAREIVAALAALSPKSQA